MIPDKYSSALKHVADVAKTWGKFSPKQQRRREKSKVALLKVNHSRVALLKVKNH